MTFKQDGIWFDREALYELAWTEPVSTLAPRFGYSGAGFAKICKRSGVPLPSRGYWARRQAGKSPRRQPLPKATPGQERKVRLSRLSEDAQTALGEVSQRAVDAKRELKDFAFPRELVNPQALIQAARMRLKRTSGWKHPKGLRSAPEEVINLEVTEGTLERALLFFNVLINELSSRSGEIRIDSANKETLLRLDGVDLPITLAEHVRRNRHEITAEEKKLQQRYWNTAYRDPSANFPHIPQYDYSPSGQLMLSVGRWPSKTWRDTARTRLEQRVPEVIAGILAFATEMRQRAAKQAKAQAERQEELARYHAKMEERSHERKAFAALKRDARNWAIANQIRAYVSAMVEHNEHDSMPQRDLEWSAWASQKAAWLDPLLKVSDIILDAPEPEPPTHW